MLAFMLGKGDCYDNAPIERFWWQPEKRAGLPPVLPTRADARVAIHEYIECFYNARHSRIENVLPALFAESFSWIPALSAAVRPG